MKFVLKQFDTELISFVLRLEGAAVFVCTSPRFQTDHQLKQLWKLIDFRFTHDRNYNLPVGWLEALEAFLQKRILVLLRNTKTDKKDN